VLKRPDDAHLTLTADDQSVQVRVCDRRAFDHELLLRLATLLDRHLLDEDGGTTVQTPKSQGHQDVLGVERAEVGEKVSTTLESRQQAHVDRVTEGRHLVDLHVRPERPDCGDPDRPCCVAAPDVDDVDRGPYSRVTGGDLDQ
jgi:hypothetical protein